MDTQKLSCLQQTLCKIISHCSRRLPKKVKIIKFATRKAEQSQRWMELFDRFFYTICYKVIVLYEKYCAANY